MATPDSSIGAERLKADQRHFGGLIFALGIAATYGALAPIAQFISGDGNTADSGIELALLIANILQVFFGTVAMFTGYMSVVYDKGNPKLTGFAILVTQLAWTPYITGMVDVGQTARKDPDDPEQTFIPSIYNPSESQVKFVGAMGILAILAYGSAYIGSLAFMEFALFAYQAGKPQDRPASYFRGRSRFYNFVLIVAGFTQLALGAFVLQEIDDGPLDEPVGVAMYTIFYPEISVTVGLVQFLVGCIGLARSMGIGVGGENDHKFQVLCFINYMCMFSLQLITQVSYAPGGAQAAAAPSRALVYLGMAFMPAYLDVKMRCTPEEFEADHFYSDKKVAAVEKDQDVEEKDVEQDVEKEVEQHADDVMEMTSA